ncbi:4720_t:CDS:2, partial [Racocetra persica]
VAISNQYPRTIVRHCAFHIRQNLIKKVKPKLQSKWDTLINDFYVMRNSLTSTAFERCWTTLINKYPEFGVELRLKDEAKYSRWQEFWNMNPTTGIPG